MFMISIAEKDLALKHSMDYFDSPEGILLFKVLASFIAATTGFSEFLNLPDDIFIDKVIMKSMGEKMLCFMTDMAI